MVSSLPYSIYINVYYKSNIYYPFDTNYYQFWIKSKLRSMTNEIGERVSEQVARPTSLITYRIIS